MRRGQKRRSPAWPRGSEMVQTSVLQENDSAAGAWKQALTGDELAPADAVLQGLLVNGPRRYRVLTQIDAEGHLLPTALVVDNLSKTVATYPTAHLHRLAPGNSPEQAAVLRRWSEQYRAQQALHGGGA